MSWLTLAGLPVFAYFLGSIPFGLLVTVLSGGPDIRSAGSGNIGATNVLRTSGRLPGVLTLSGDVLKGAVPVLLAGTLAGHGGFWADGYVALTAAAAFSGHLLPVYTRCKGGGKGVATAAGCFLVISPTAVVVALLVFVLLVCVTGRVSVGSLAGSAVLPLAVWKSTASVVFTGLAVALALAIAVRHRENIGRLLTGSEPPVW